MRLAWFPALAALLLSACSSSPPNTAATNKPYLVGATVDLSGPLSAYGKGFAAAWQGYFSAVDAKGGINSRQVKLEILDDKSDSNTSVANARELVAKGALLVSGITVSDTCQLLAPTLTHAHVAELCTTIPADLVISPPPYVYAMSDPETMWVNAIVRIVQSTTKNQAVKVATVVPNVRGLEDMARSFEAEATVRGWSVATHQDVALSSLSNVTSQVAAVLASGANVVLSDISMPGAVAIDNGLRAGGFTGPIIMGNSDYPTLATLKDPNFYQIWSTRIVTTSSNEEPAKSMVSALSSQGVTGVSSINAADIPVEYLGAVLVGTALSSCQAPCDSKAFNKVLSSTKVDLSGLTVDSYGFSSGQNVPDKFVDVYHWDLTHNAPALWEQGIPAFQPLPGVNS